MRSRYLPTWVLVFFACAAPSVATNQQGCAPSQSQYTNLKAPDGGVVVACGTAGNRAQAAFSYRECQQGTAGGCPFCLAVAVGGTASIYVDAPFATISTVRSGDPEVATFELTVAGTEIDILRETGVSAGQTLLTLLDSSGAVIDETDVTVAQPDTTFFTTAPMSSTLDLLQGATATTCGTPLSNGMPVIGPELIGGATLGGVSIAPVPPVGVDWYATVWGIPFGVCYDVAVRSGTSGALAVWGPDMGQIWQIADVPPDTRTVISFSPPALTLEPAGSAQVSVTVEVSGTPIVGGLCDWSAPDNFSITNVASPGEIPIGSLILGSEAETTAYLVTEVSAATGTFSITCNLDNGLVSGSLPVTVGP